MTENDLKARLLNDMKEAMKNKDALTKQTIQYVRAAILQYEKDNQVELDNVGVMEIINKQVKDRNNDLATYGDIYPTETVEQIEEEIKILKSYLPEPLSEDELKQLIQTTASELNITDKKDMGKLIKSVKQQVVAANGKLISDLVKEYLGV